MLADGEKQQGNFFRIGRSSGMNKLYTPITLPLCRRRHRNHFLAAIAKNPAPWFHGTPAQHGPIECRSHAPRGRRHRSRPAPDIRDRSPPAAPMALHHAHVRPIGGQHAHRAPPAPASRIMVCRRAIQKMLQISITAEAGRDLENAPHRGILYRLRSSESISGKVIDALLGADPLSTPSENGNNWILDTRLWICNRLSARVFQINTEG